jgi:hypothetical protein
MASAYFWLVESYLHWDPPFSVLLYRSVTALRDTDAFVDQLSETILEALIQVNKEEANTTTYRGAYV